MGDDRDGSSDIRPAALVSIAVFAILSIAGWVVVFVALTRMVGWL